MVQKVTLQPDAWNIQAEKLLAPTIDEGDPTYSMTEMRQSVQRGRSKLFRVVESVSGREAPRLLGWVVLFVENYGGGRELVLQTGAALQNTSGAFAKAVPEILEYGQRQGCASVRSHVLNKNAHLAKLFKRAGFDKTEVIYRAVI